MGTEGGNGSLGGRLATSFHVLREQSNYGWNRDLEPALVVGSGSELTLHTMDSSGGQIKTDSTEETIRTLDFTRVNPVSGPVYVEGAKPGQTLEVELLEMTPPRFGWTAQIPGFGLLTDQFPEPWLKLWHLSGPLAEFADGIRIPIHPFCGVIGVSPAEEGTLSVVPPRRVGGNLDVKQLGPGTKLYLPIEVEGALLGIGDTHAAQGDGEVCGTAIESQMDVTVRATVRPNLQIETPEYEFVRPLEDSSAAASGYYATTGVGPDLLADARESVERMIVHLGREYKLSPEDAYGLCSVAVDLKISEVVDAPNWVVSAFLPRQIFSFGK